ncbi:MAG: TonB-dependent receptor [Gammaproteobacteria bacterium]|nr:TonB-dependent receptor [Gammaproteobacteria bacterium]
MHLRNLLISSCLVPFLAVGGSITALAEEEEAEKITVIGTRSHERSAADLAVPVDTLDSTSLLRQGASRMEDMLSRVAPSFTVGLEPLSDAATLVRPANMRGLPPDSTLVLVNGKRRHRSSVITFLGNGLNDGAHGADLSAIPAIALDRVEVLRDNAGAQYGSDAVAGILNFVLKEDSEGGSVDVRWGQYYQGDGENITVSANVGLPLTENGFLNLSAEYNEADPTIRGTHSDRSNYLVNAGNMHVKDPPIVWGAPDIEDNYKLFANAAIGLGALHEVYAFGNYAERTVDGGFYFRSPRRREGIFAGKEDKSIADREARQPSLVIDQMPWLITNTAPSPCEPPSVEDSAAGSGDSLDTIAKSPRCYAFNLKFPGGFTPQFGGDVEDSSIAIGLRGEVTEDFTYDISYVYGRHEVDHFIYNTINPQLAALENDIPTSYSPGGYVETDQVFNLDFTTSFDVDAFFSPLHVGFGVEWREEEFETKRGDLNSWFIDYYTNDLDGNGTTGDLGEFEEPANLATMSCAEYQEHSARKDLVRKYGDDPLNQLGIGSNGFVGFNPCIEGKEDRSSVGAYVDFESDVTEDLLLGLALRHEDPEDFDSTLDGKFSARLQATDTLALRGSVGTGFRVPTVGQTNVRNVTTGITAGQLIDQLTLPPTHALLQGVAEPLDAEESTSFGLGAVINVGGFDLTIDYYHIEVDDRIGATSKEPVDCLLMRRAGGQGNCVAISEINETVGGANTSLIGLEGDDTVTRQFRHTLSSTTGAVKDDDVNQELLRKALMAREELRPQLPAIDSIGEAKYFANDFDTTTEGIDIVATYPMEFLDGLTTLTLAANWNRTKVDSFNPRTIDAKKKHIIEAGRPKVRWTLTADHESGPWQILTRVRYYGAHVDYAGAGLDPDMMKAEARTLVDFEAAYSFTDNFALAIGAENLLDNEPTRHRYQESYGNLYPESTPFDYNGGFYYAKAMLNF